MRELLKSVLVGVVVLAALFFFKASEKSAKPGAVKTLLGTFYLKNG